MTEFGVGDERAPMLGDTFEAELSSGWHVHKDFIKKFFHVVH